MKKENYKVIDKAKALANWWNEYIYLREKKTGDIYRLKIEYDDMPLNPRTDYDGNLCTIFSQRGNWDIGDSEFSYTRDEAPKKYEEFKNRQDKGEILMLPVYMYELHTDCATMYLFYSHSAFLLLSLSMILIHRESKNSYPHNTLYNR